MGRIEITSDEGNYETRAHGFHIEDDLYMFFEFESPKSKCTIGIAYDQYASGGDWYGSDGHVHDNDWDIVTNVVFDRLPVTPEFERFDNTVLAARYEFNRSQSS